MIALIGLILPFRIFQNIYSGYENIYFGWESRIFNQLARKFIIRLQIYFSIFERFLTYDHVSSSEEHFKTMFKTSANGCPFTIHIRFI